MRFGLDSRKLPRALIVVCVAMLVAIFAITQGLSGGTNLIPPSLVLAAGAVVFLLCLWEIVKIYSRMRKNPEMIISEEGIEDTSPAGRALGFIPWPDIEAVIVHRVKRKNGFVMADNQVLGLLPRDAQILRDPVKARQYLAYGISADPLAPDFSALLDAVGRCSQAIDQRQEGFPLKKYPAKLDTSPIVRGIYRQE